MPTPETVARLLRSHRIDLSDEKAAQAQIAEVLRGEGIAFEREVRLAPRDILDFLVLPHLAIEVKLRSTGKMDVFRQLQRYAAHERVGVVMLVSNLAMTLPETIDGKPAFFLSLGRAWL